MKKRSLGTAAVVAALMMTVTACSGTQSTPASTQPAGNSQGGNTSTEGTPKLSGKILVDGSSTVGPITIAAAEEFQKEHDVTVDVGISGSTGGFKKWVKGEIDINNSSRKIKQEEIDEARAAGFDALEIPVAYDGISVVVNKENAWLQCITKDELKKIWDKDATVKTWQEVNPAWPAEEIKLYGPGTDSGTFEFFTEFANGKAKQSRADYTASEDDNVLVQGVAGNKNSLGYFGYAYYLENKDAIRAVPVDAGKGCVAPSEESIADLSYPISRLIYIYPSTKALERPEVKEFVKYYLKNAPSLVKETGYIPLSQQMYNEFLAKL